MNPAIGYDIWDDPDKALNIQLGGGVQSEVVDEDSQTSSLIDWRLTMLM